MSFVTDFFDSLGDGLLPAVIAGIATGGLGAFAWSAFNTVLIAGGVSRALARQEEIPEGDITVTTRSPTRSRRIVYGKRRIGGTVVYMHSTDDDSQIHYVIALCEGPIEAIDEIYFGDEIAVEANGTAVSKYSGVIQVDKKLGTDSQTASSLAVQETPDTGNGEWISEHRLRGTAYLYIEFSYDRDKFPQGIPNISAVVRGRNDIDDPRDSSTGYTTNPALCLKHYIEDSKYGLNGTVNDTAVSTAANVCEEQVSLKAGGTENRYTLNGIVDSSDTPKTILNDICNSMAGWVTFIGGQWRMQAGEHRSPTIELTEGNMISDLSVTTRASRRERFNSVRGTFVSPDNEYQPADFPAYKDTSAISEDNGEVIWQDIELPYTATASMAQRLARIEVERMRREILVEGMFDLSALQLIAGDVIELTDDQFGWDQKQFEVTDMDTDFSESPGVALTLRETDSGVYDWSSDDEQESEQAPETDFPDPFTVSAPENLSVASGTAQLFRKKDGTVVSRIKATWDQSSGAFVDRYQVQYKKSADSDWTNSGDVDDDNRVAFAWEVEDDVDYDVRVRAVNQLGVRSSWTTDTNHTVVGKTTSPADVASFSAQQNREFVTFKWSRVSEADVAGYEIRYKAPGIYSWKNANIVTKVTRGTLVTNASIPPGTWRVGIKAVDSSGNESDNDKTSDITVINEFDLIETVNEHPGWGGTIETVNGIDSGVVHAVSGRLVPNSQSTAAGDNYDVFDNFVLDPVDELRYTSSEIDIDFDERCRVWSGIEAALGPEETGEADPEFFLDSRLDSGSYDGFETWSIGVREARFFKGQVRMNTDTGVGYLDEFALTADLLERSERTEGFSVSSSGSTLSFNQPFHSKPNVEITPGDGALFAIYRNKTTTSVDIELYDSSGTQQSGTADITVTGV